jgi:hypothetical protein
MQGQDFAGLIYLRQRRAQIGRTAEDLMYIAESVTEEETQGDVIFLPL